MGSNHLQPEIIDAVITWVNGNESIYRQKLLHYLTQTTFVHEEAISPTRFGEVGELEFCLVSLFRFAPWLRHIYLVTDNQTPALLSKFAGTDYEHRIHLIDHKIIFSGFSDALPTFNSRTIESLLWRIPGLAEKFLYLNDDFFLIRPVSPENFFYHNKVVLRGEWKKQQSHSLYYRIRAALKAFKQKYRPKKVHVPKHSLAQIKAAQLLGHTENYFYLYHSPHSLRLSTLANYFSNHAEQLRFNINFRFRHAEQFLTTALASHLEIANNNVVFEDKLRCLQLKLSAQSLRHVKRQLADADRDKNVAFVCIQSLDSVPLLTQNTLFSWLDKRVGSLDSFLANQLVEACIPD
ncbi:TPA: hypothetical protein ACPSKB_001105 [Legionella feeleii]